MELTDFVYHRPESLEAACELLKDNRREAHLLAGGTELLVDLKQHTMTTRHVVSLSGISGLRRIYADAEGVHLGALATHNEILRSEVLQKSFPALAEAAGTMAAVQVRNRGTLGGNFCSAVPSADLPPICIAAGAMVRLVGAGATREVEAHAFFEGPRQTVRQPDEILVEILIPKSSLGEGVGARYHKFGLRGASALAVVGVAAWVRLKDGTITEARLALGAVHPTPLLVEEASKLLAGQTPSPELFQKAAAIASAACTPLDDIRGSAAYRRELVSVLTVRALSDACGRAAA